MRATAIETTRIGAGQRTMAVPIHDASPGCGSATLARIEEAEMTGNRQHGRTQCERSQQREEDPDRRGQAQALKVGQPGETEAGDRAGDRQA